MIREAVESDIPMIVGLWKEMMVFHVVRSPLYRMRRDAEHLYESYLRKVMEEKKAVVFVFEEYNTILGYLFTEIAELPPVYETCRIGLMKEICVSPESRNNGIATRLVETAERNFASLGIRRIESTVSDFNEVSKSFWASRGYKPYNSRCVKQL